MIPGPELAQVPTLSLLGLLPCLGMDPPPRSRKGSLNGPTARPMTTATGMGASRMTASTQSQKRRTACRYGTGPPAVGAPEPRALAGRLGRPHGCGRRGDYSAPWKATRGHWGH